MPKQHFIFWFFLFVCFWCQHHAWKENARKSNWGIINLINFITVLGWLRSSAGLLNEKPKAVVRVQSSLTKELVEKFPCAWHSRIIEQNRIVESIKKNKKRKIHLELSEGKTPDILVVLRFWCQCHVVVAH